MSSEPGEKPINLDEIAESISQISQEILDAIKSKQENKTFTNLDSTIQKSESEHEKRNKELKEKHEKTKEEIRRKWKRY